MQKVPSRLRSLRNPLLHSTELIESIRVLLSTCFINSSNSTLPSTDLTMRVSTPLCLRFHQGYTFAGNSISGMTTLSPSCQSNPFATIEIPSEVFLTKAISSRSALISSANFFRVRSSSRIQVS